MRDQHKVSGTMSKLFRKKKVVIKLSGSIFGSGTKSKSIKEYGMMITELNKHIQPIVITGGGNIARHYIDLARGFGSDEASLDLLGIEVSRLNAKLLLHSVGGRVYPKVPTNLEEVSIAAVTDEPVILGGLHPGQSTNATSALVAEKVKAQLFVNATDVNGIYDSDPNINRHAKAFKKITVDKCIEVLGKNSSMAGKYDLMDMVALKIIERSRIPTVILRASVTNIIKAIKSDTKIGTRILA
ncbi:MAG TPA: UMP kinase [Nitrososphaeraceae archaeon]|nr:UMP kinase [Nitrososphaeraceae archaeon]